MWTRRWWYIIEICSSEDHQQPASKAAIMYWSNMNCEMCDSDGMFEEN
jgi:hypothetical protein